MCVDSSLIIGYVYDDLTSVGEGASWPIVTGNNREPYLGAESVSLCLH